MTCTRRVVLHTIGVAAAGCMMSACTGGEGDGNVPVGVAAMCGANLCLNLSENAELMTVGGILIFTQAPGRKIFVTRTSDVPEFRALSGICTHAGCTIDWNGSDKFDCGCHGSQFSALGAVTKGPAGSNLRTFATTLAGDVLTINL